MRLCPISTIQSDPNQLRLFIVHFIFLIPIILYLSFYNLESGSNFGNGTGIDESWYIQVSQEISESGQWWLPTREGVPFFYKPPLKFWLTSISTTLLGDSIRSYRIVDATLGVLLVLLAYLVSANIFNSLNAGLFSSLSLLACHGFLFFNGIRFATLDTLIVFLTSAALLILCYVTSHIAQSTKKQQVFLGILVGLFIGLAVLTKSVLGYYVFGIYFSWLLVSGLILNVLKNLKIFLITVILTSIVLPALWFVPHALLTTGAWQRMFGYELVSRFGAGFHNSNNKFYYIDFFLKHKYLPTLTTVLAVLYVITRAIKVNDKKLYFFIVWGILGFLTFSLLSSRLPWYIAPCYFPFAILNGGLIGSIIEKITSYTCCNIKHEKNYSLFSIRALAVKMLTTVALFFVTVTETFCYVYANIKTVSIGSPRLAIDYIVEDLAELKNPPRTYNYKALNQATRERIFYNMLEHKPEKISNYKSLIPLTKGSSDFVVFTRLSSALDLVDKFDYNYYYLMPPVDFPQGPDAVLRSKTAVAFLGLKEPKLLKHFQPRKVILELDKDLRTCKSFQNEAYPRKNNIPLVALDTKVTCRFKGNPLLSLVPTRFALDIGHSKEVQPFPSLTVNINNKIIKNINSFNSRLSIYEYRIPKHTWMDGDNVIELTYKPSKLKSNDNHKKIQNKISYPDRIVLNWLVVDLAVLNKLKPQE